MISDFKYAVVRQNPMLGKDGTPVALFDDEANADDYCDYLCTSSTDDYYVTYTYETSLCEGCPYAGVESSLTVRDFDKLLSSYSHVGLCFNDMNVYEAVYFSFRYIPDCYKNLKVNHIIYHEIENKFVLFVNADYVKNSCCCSDK